VVLAQLIQGIATLNFYW